MGCRCLLGKEVWGNELRRKVGPRSMTGRCGPVPDLGEEYRIECTGAEIELSEVGATQARAICTCTPRPTGVISVFRSLRLHRLGKELGKERAGRGLIAGEWEAPPRCYCGMQCRCRNTPGRKGELPICLLLRIRYALTFITIIRVEIDETSSLSQISLHLLFLQSHTLRKYSWKCVEPSEAPETATRLETCLDQGATSAAP